MLGTVVALNVWVAIKANSDPSFAIEPDYYRKAVAWDSAMAQQRRNTKLDWTLTPALSAFARAGGAVLRVTLTDRHGAAVRDAHIEVTAFSNARAGTVHAATLSADGVDAYTATIPVQRTGQWELRFDVTRGGEHFTVTKRLEAVAATAPVSGYAP